MSMFYILFSLAFLLSLSLNLYFWVRKVDVSIESGLKRLKTSLIRLMIFYQSNYNGSDQLVFIAKWLENVGRKLSDVPNEQMKLFKEKVNGL